MAKATTIAIFLLKVNNQCKIHKANNVPNILKPINKETSQLSNDIMYLAIGFSSLSRIVFRNRTVKYASKELTKEIQNQAQLNKKILRRLFNRLDNLD